jgi:hypothetical protein
LPLTFERLCSPFFAEPQPSVTIIIAATNPLTRTEPEIRILKFPLLGGGKKSRRWQTLPLTTPT